MNTASAKAKGRKLQQWVRDQWLALYPNLTHNDVRSTGMGQQGTDVQLSERARRVIPFDTECKSHAKFAVYSMFQQAAENTEEGRTPLLVIKQNHSEPLAVLRFDDFINILDNKGLD